MTSNQEAAQSSVAEWLEPVHKLARAMTPEEDTPEVRRDIAHNLLDHMEKAGFVIIRPFAAA